MFSKLTELKRSQGKETSCLKPVTVTLGEVFCYLHEVTGVTASSYQSYNYIELRHCGTQTLPYTRKKKCGVCRSGSQRSPRLGTV